MDGPLLQTALRSPEFLGSVLVLLPAYTIRFFLPFQSKKIDGPTVLGKPGDMDYHAALDEGYKQFKDSTFTIPTAHHAILIIPNKFLDEIEALPENAVSFQTQVDERFLGKYTGIRVNDTLVHSVKVGSLLFIGDVRTTDPFLFRKVDLTKNIGIS